MTPFEEKKIVQEIVYKKTFDLKPSNCQSRIDLTTSKHYTFVGFPPEEVKQKIAQYRQDLMAIDRELLFNPPELFHYTFFHCSLEENVVELKNAISKYMSKVQHLFEVENLLATPIGISVNIYSLDEEFVCLRQSLYQIVKKEFVLDDRGIASWINIARYKQEPKPEVFEYIRSHFADHLGQFPVDKICLYESESKILEHAKLICEIKK